MFNHLLGRRNIPGPKPPKTYHHIANGDQKFLTSYTSLVSFTLIRHTNMRFLHTHTNGEHNWTSGWVGFEIRFHLPIDGRWPSAQSIRITSEGLARKINVREEKVSLKSFIFQKKSGKYFGGFSRKLHPYISNTLFPEIRPRIETCRRTRPVCVLSIPPTKVGLRPWRLFNHLEVSQRLGVEYRAGGTSCHRPVFSRAAPALHASMGMRSPVNFSPANGDLLRTFFSPTKRHFWHTSYFLLRYRVGIS